MSRGLTVFLLVACAVLVGQPRGHASSINTTAPCGNPLYCVYDVATYKSNRAAEEAFVSAVLGSNNPVGSGSALTDREGAGSTHLPGYRFRRRIKAHPARGS